MADTDKLEKIKAQDDVNILDLIEGKVQEIEHLGYPTDTVFVPDIKNYVEVYKIKKLKAKIGDRAAVKFANDEQSQKYKTEIQKLQEQIKADGYEFLIRGYGSEVYAELNLQIDKKTKELPDGEKLPETETIGVQLLALSVAGYTKDGEFTDWSDKPQKEKAEFLVKLDPGKQLALLDRAVSGLIQTSLDLDQALQDVVF